MIRKLILRWLGLEGISARTEKPSERDQASSESFPVVFTEQELAELRVSRTAVQRPVNPWSLGSVAPGVLPDKPSGGVLALDSAMFNPGLANVYTWAQSSTFKEGLGFLGYPYLAELSQRPEYRRAVEIIAGECTRKWIKLHGAEDSVLNDLADALDNKFQVRAVFRKAIEVDGFFGRAHIYPDIGYSEDDAEQTTALILDPAKIGKDGLTGFKVIEPFWCYPGIYNSTNPMAADFYQPTQWYVMSKTVHATRMATIVMREMPDMLKPAYQFGGLSLSQMGKPYVDNWLRTRQSVSDLIRNFSIVILKTTIGAMLANKARELIRRAKAFTLSRDNQGLMMIDKDSEELDMVNTPLGSLDKLQAQAQEHMSSVWGIPLIIYLGITPSGLNATADPEIRAFFTHIGQLQERFRNQLMYCLQIVQLSTRGKIDPKIGFDFIPLWEMDEKEKSEIRKSDAEASKTYVDMGAVSNEEVREKLSEEEGGLFQGVDLAGEAPPPPAEKLLDKGHENALEMQENAAATTAGNDE